MEGTNKEEFDVTNGETRLKRLVVARDRREGRKIVLEAPLPTTDCSIWRRRRRAE